jgi:hypothetical protein
MLRPKSRHLSRVHVLFDRWRFFTAMLIIGCAILIAVAYWDVLPAFSSITEWLP